MDFATVISLIGLILVVAGGLFGVYMNLSGKIDRIYERMDENKEQYYDDFLLKASHEESMRYIKDLYQEKHDGIEKKLDDVAREIMTLKDYIIKNK